MRIFKATATTHDFFTTVARELKIGVPTRVIGNTTLLYAVNLSLDGIHRVASGSTPHYEEDSREFKVYATAGIFEEQGFAIISNGKQNLDNELQYDFSISPVKITYNSVDSTELISMERSVFHRKEDKLNFPKLGAYLCYPPLATFSFFTLGGKGNPIIRVGKKSPPTRVIYEELQEVQLDSGEFEPSHAVQLADLSPETKVLEGSLIVLPNGLVLSKGKLKGPYFVGRLGRRKYFVARPDEHRFPKILNS